MHELAKKETTRTDLGEAQKKRIAERANNAMTQVIQRRNRSLMMWGKSEIKRYPDGGQEIIVSQNLTPEQEQYEFPPRSKLLKVFDTSKKRQESFETIQEFSSSPFESLPSPQPNSNFQPQPQLDQFALNEWFAKKPVNNNRVVIDWMSDIERHSRKSEKTKKKKLKLSPTTSNNNSNKILFKSDTGKRWANSIQNSTLHPPDEDGKRHYIPRRLLVKKQVAVTETVSRIQSMWKEYQTRPHQFIESKIALAAMSSTGEKTPIAGMVRLVHKLHESHKIREQKSADRLEKVESLLKEERRKRALAEASIKQLGLIPSNELKKKSRKSTDSTLSRKSKKITSVSSGK